MEVEITTRHQPAATPAIVRMRWSHMLPSLHPYRIGIPALLMIIQRGLRACSHRHRVVRELECLSDIDLTDIGVARSEIRWIALTQLRSPSAMTDIV